MTLEAHDKTTRSRDQFAKVYGSRVGFDGRVFVNEFFDHTYRTATAGRSGTERSNGHAPTNFRRDAARVIVNNPYTQVNGDENKPNERVVSTRYITMNVQDPLDHGPWYWPVFDVEIANASNAANVAARNKLGDAKTQLAVDLAEAVKTANMLADSASELAKALLAFKRGNFSSIPSIFGMSRRDLLSGKFAADRWLQFQYGYKPLYGSIHGTYQLLRRQCQKDLILYARATKRWSKTDTYDDGRVIRTVKGSGGVKYYYAARVKTDFLRGAQQAGMINPLSVAWELVPYSFVVDWFIPVGNVLESLSATAGLDFVFGSRSTFDDWTLDYQQKTIKHYYDQWVTSSGSLQARRYRFTRENVGGFVMPQLYANSNPFSTPRIASALALIRNLFK